MLISSGLSVNRPKSEPSAQGASNFLATGLPDPFRAFTCTHNRTTESVSHLPARLGAQLDYNSAAGKSCGLSCGNNDASARTSASTVIAVTHSRIKVHGVPCFEVERLGADCEIQFPGN